MQSEIAKIEAKLVTTRAKLLDAVSGLAETAWDWRPEDGRWSIRLTLAHVGSAQWSHLEVAQRLVAGQSVEISGFDLDEWNDARVAERADWTPGQVLSDLEAGQRETLAFLEGLEPEQLAITGTYPALGKVSVSQSLRIIPVHDNLHRRDILRLRQEMQPV